MSSPNASSWARVGVDIDGERRFLDADKVEVLDPAPVDEAEVARRTEQALRNGWPSIYRSFVHTAGAPLPA